jgi:hypothetical protein
MEQLTQTFDDTRRDSVFAGADWTDEGQARTAGLESQYQQIWPYIEQTNRFKAGMRYRFCPELYPIETGQVNFLRRVGSRIGELWQEASRKTPLGFRIDFLQRTDGNLFISEVQTDDRGLPEMAILRNAFGLSGFNGVTAGMVRALESAYPEAQTLLFAYPNNEAFYYSAFPDLTKLLNFEARAMQGKKLNFVAVAGSKLTDDQGGYQTGDYRNPVDRADLVYDFTGTILPNLNCVVPADKMFIRDLSKLALRGDSVLAGAVPFTCMFEPPKIAYTAKENFVIKPVNGRWSRGLLIGSETSANDWAQGLRQVENGKAVLQSYIEPARIPFRVRTESKLMEKADGIKREITEISYPLEMLYTRLEAYYCFDGRPEKGGFNLADVMVTARPEYPVKGMRDCIMVPANLYPDR